MKFKNVPYLIVLSVFVVFSAISGCKESPSFSVTNENDPLHEDFVLPVPKNIHLSPDFTDFTKSNFERLNISWDAVDNEKFIRGYLLTSFDGELGNFVEITRIPKFTYMRHSLYENEIDLKIAIQIHTYITYNDDSIRISEPVTGTYDQTINNFGSSITNSGAYKLSWSHNIFTSKANFHIERSINNGDFELVSEVNNHSTSFLDEVDFAIHDEISYRIFAKTEYFSTDTLYVRNDPIQLQPPKSIKLLHSDETQIDFAIVHPSFAEAFQVELEMPDQTTYSSFEIPFSGNDTTFFTLQDLPDADKFSVLVRSKYKTSTSDFSGTNIVKGPYINHDRTVYLPSSEYQKPKLSKDGTKLSFLTYKYGFNNSEYGYDYYQVNIIDVENSRIIPLPDKVHSQYNAYDYLNEQELIYTVTEDFIKAWDLEGNEIDSWQHLAKDEVYSMFFNYEAERGVLKYDEMLNVYNLTNNSLKNAYVDGYHMLPSQNKEYIFVYNEIRNFFIQRHHLNDLNSYNQLSSGYMPDEVLIGPNNEVILISENKIEVYNSSNFNLLNSINAEFGEVNTAAIIDQSVVAIISDHHYINFYDIYTGDFMGEINWYDYTSELNTEWPSLYEPKLFYSSISKNVYLLGKNVLGIYSLTDRWIQSSP